MLCFLVADLGFYALSAKECVDDCLVSPLSVSSSGSSDTEAFSLIVKVILHTYIFFFFSVIQIMNNITVIIYFSLPVLN